MTSKVFIGFCSTCVRPDENIVEIKKTPFRMRWVAEMEEILGDQIP